MDKEIVTCEHVRHLALSGRADEAERIISRESFGLAWVIADGIGTVVDWKLRARRVVQLEEATHVDTNDADPADVNPCDPADYDDEDDDTQPWIRPLDPREVGQ